MVNNSVIITAILGEQVPTDHYGIFRGEGRLPINIGFGLAELGYNVNIIYEFFKEFSYEINCPPMGSITLSKQPIHKEYDFQLVWDRFQDVKSKKNICIINYPHEIKNITKLNSIFVTPYKGLVDYMEQESKRKVNYLPQLNPIPTYHLGFKRYNYNIVNKETINIFLYMSSWERNVPCIREYDIILERIKYLLNNQYPTKKIKLFIQVNDNSMIRDCKSLLKYGNEIEFIGKYRYDKYLQFIEDMDILILKGTQFMASAGMYDIISLGKPLLYVSETLHPGIWRNPFYDNNNKENLIFVNENERSIKRKIDNFINNPEILYNKFKECLSDNNFENWKRYALMIFKL